MKLSARTEIWTAVALAWGFCGLASACTPAAAGILSQVATVLSDAGNILNLVDVAWRSAARAKPPSEADQKRFDQLLADSYRALSIANSSVRGAKDLDQKQYDAAFADFKRSYSELNAFLLDKGVVSKQGLVGLGNAESLPEPAALDFKVSEQ